MSKLNSRVVDLPKLAPAFRLQWPVRVKYALDRCVAAVGLLLLAPVLLAIAIAIKLGDGGPVLFLQDRHGEHGKLFRIYKFRSMIVDADRYLDKRGRAATANRVTTVGRFLRRTSLDELPQLFNVLRGDMSLVGPRPLLPDHFHKLSVPQRLRFCMRPGLTGLAQVHGRNTLKWSQRLAYDVQYVTGYSWWSDVRILWRTIGVVLSQSGVVLDRNPEQADDLSGRAA